MPSENTEPIDLLDLKLLPAWVKEAPDANEYAHHEGDTGEERPRRDGRRPREGKRRPPSTERRPSRSDKRPQRRPQDRHGGDRPDSRGQDRHREAPPPKALEIAVRFQPHPPAFESVAAQIKGEALAYSLFSLARLFLQKPERYDVHLTAKPESPFYQLGENGAISSDRAALENNAFRFAQNDFYKIDITQSEPIKGNFTSVARDRLSGTLLGPTNHHAYQPRLRTLYEQRFSRRMSFADYQRQIEIVSDPALVEQWKEEARTVTTFTTLQEEPPVAFTNAADAEKNFRQKHLPNFVRAISETTMDGVTSRTIGDRRLRSLIEEAWSTQTRSPSQMMQELANRFREAGLQIFRHRKGMLFVTPIRVRQFVHEQTSVSEQVRGILDAVAANARINRKDLAEKLLVDLAPEEADARKIALASDLRWLISEGYVIEFNDGSLDLPRAKVKPQIPSVEAAVSAAEESTSTQSETPAAETAASTEEAEIGGS